MKYCSHCGAALSDNALFCANCGAKTNQSQPQDNGDLFGDIEVQSVNLSAYSTPVPEEKRESPAMAITALSLTIVSLLLSFAMLIIPPLAIVFMGFAFVMSIASIVLSIIVLRKNKTQGHKIMAIISLILSILTLIGLAIFGMLVVIGVVLILSHPELYPEIFPDTPNSATQFIQFIATIFKK